MNSNQRPEHACGSVERYTPKEVCCEIHRIMRSYAFPSWVLDPASCKLANSVVHADQYYSLKDNNTDGLTTSWKGHPANNQCIFLNPPGGKTGGKSNQKLWADKFCKEFAIGNFELGAFVCFNPALLFTHAGLWDNSTVFLFKDRFHFLSEREPNTLDRGQWKLDKEGQKILKNGSPIWTDSPSHNSAIVLKHREMLPPDAFDDLPHTRVSRIKLLPMTPM